MYVFAQLRQLPALAPYIPTKEPRLRQTAYEMVLHSFLLSPADHPRLLDALLKWPPDLYSIPSLTQSVINRSAPCPVCSTGKGVWYLEEFLCSCIACNCQRSRVCHVHETRGLPSIMLTSEGGGPRCGGPTQSSLTFLRKQCARLIPRGRL